MRLNLVQGEEIKGKTYYEGPGPNETYWRDGEAHGFGVHDAYYN